MLNTSIDGISSLTFRARICKAQGINRQFAGNVMLRLDEVKDYSNYVDAFWQAITVGKGSYAFPSDEEFVDALEHKDLYQTLRSRGTKYLLYTMEAYSPFPKGLPPFDDDTLSVEHIMPRTLTAQWKIYLSKVSLENYDSSLHRLGNLALTNYNGEMSNKNFSDKKQIYKQSKFYYTTQIDEYDQWQIEEINDRSKRLAECALKIWQLPPQYQGKKAAPASLHTLGEDTTQFAYTKPSMIMIGDHEFSLNYWSDILPILCELLNNDNHETFMEIARPDKISAFGIEDEEHSYSSNSHFAHVTENVYIRQFMSAASILDTVTRIAEAYDKAAGTDYAGNILFSLK